MIQNNRRILSWDFCDGGGFDLLARGTPSTERVLDLLEILIAWKRRELADIASKEAARALPKETP